MGTPATESRPTGFEAVKRFIDEQGTGYVVIEHEETFTAGAEARTAGVAPDHAAKTVMLRDDGGAYRMAVVPASEHLDLRKARRVAGTSSLRLATEQELQADFPGFEVGALPPFGALFGAAAMMDPRVPARGRVLCNGGDHRHSVVLDSHDLQRLAAAELADIVEEPRFERPRFVRGTPVKTMLAYQLTAWQQPPELREVPIPEPGPGEVLVRIGGAGACHSDLHLMEWPEGQVGFSPPFTLGHENGGWVDRVGAGVHGVRPGEAVAVYGPWGCGRCRSCRMSSENYCEQPPASGVMGGGLGLDGGMAEFMLVPSERLLVGLGDLDPRDAAPLTDAALTPYHAIKRSLHRLAPGSTAVVIGVGGLGHMAIQILRAVSPARIVVVDPAADKRALAAQVGAETVLAPGEGTLEHIREATAGRGAELVLDFVGSDDTIALAVASGRSQGDVTIVGIAGGALPWSFFGEPFECSLATTYWGSAVELMDVLDLARSGRIGARVERFALTDVAEVYDRLRRGEIAGRAVVCPEP